MESQELQHQLQVVQADMEKERKGRQQAEEKNIELTRKTEVTTGEGRGGEEEGEEERRGGGEGRRGGEGPCFQASLVFSFLFVYTIICTQKQKNEYFCQHKQKPKMGKAKEQG